MKPDAKILMIGFNFLKKFVFCLVDLEFSPSQKVHRLDISGVDFFLNAIAL